MTTARMTLRVLGKTYSVRASDAPATNRQRSDIEPASAATTGSGGWNAYDVWRVFIKEARDRRERGDIHSASLLPSQHPPNNA